MVISNSRQYIFFHIPKCGGTSVTEFLNVDCCWNDLVIGGTATGEAIQVNYAKRFALRKHSLPTQVRMAIGEDLYHRYFKFAFVRDPVCRFVSAAQFIKHHVAAKSGWIAGALEDRYVKEIRKARSLSQLVNSTLVQGVLDRLQSNPDTALNDIELCFAPQSLYLDTQEKDAGRFAYLPIEQMDDAVRTLKAHGVVSEGATVDAIRHNSSHPTLAADLDDSALTLLRSWYRLDYMLAKSSGI